MSESDHTKWPEMGLSSGCTIKVQDQVCPALVTHLTLFQTHRALGSIVLVLVYIRDVELEKYPPADIFTKFFYCMNHHFHISPLISQWDVFG